MILRANSATASSTNTSSAAEEVTTRKPAPTKTARPRKATKPKLLSGDNPQIAKGDGDAPVQAYIAAAPGWKGEVAARIDALVTRAVPGVQKAVKWNSPFYGKAGEGWFLSLHCFARYVKVTFFKGAELKPLPPGASKWPSVRYLDVAEGGLDEKQFVAWVRQASKLPGWLA